ncbi:growth-regulated protein homolog gamma-like isoform X1 [Eptesicus fuscus]|uniref:growth-regulated protein homolog gamma-like isoform X1 n=1 Tax=Eptesicus fuscus TaxID=29078 RepID=UPI002403AE5D|nr:growth-regulated protein homolog gamma-like isoform X1 [Eptesicus fuscus]
MARTATAAAAPRAPRFLRAALLLLLLAAACRQAAAAPVDPAAAPVVTELRCQCLQTVQGIHPKNIQSVQVTSPGSHCDQTEVIATLKNGQKVCLNPASPLVKKILNKMLNKASTN